ncbi:MAG TPA: ergothioneine biosynthesis protein EgtB [Acidobacteriaceae bacterium]|nr:ergothioneine biosynthesis protein EgtB [Acidobacteriaceae bacterium]
MASVSEIAESSLIREKFSKVRQQSERLCAPLSPEDMMVQSCADASPAKWHLAHTTWFFETFLLREFLPGYREYDPDFRWLFNSYYNAVSKQPEKKTRSSFSRPGAEEIFHYRRHVEEGMHILMQRPDANSNPDVLSRIVLGLNHEQQHQELLVMDMKHALWSNPLHPSYSDGGWKPAASSLEPPTAIDYEGGLIEIGSDGAGFAFDNELPRHPEYLRGFRLASRPVSCAEYLEFMEAGGYRKPEYWLSAGWDTVQAQGWHAPLYWDRLDGSWQIYTLHGYLPLEDLLATPVCHVSYFEAEAFAHWAGKRLPTEAEWEVAAWRIPVEGNLLESGRLHPDACEQATGSDPVQLFGDVWEWTQSPYVGYPGFYPLPGALGEYNGKFMSNQMVLRGGSAVTPASHIRATYRNFFGPQTRWQFSGIRLAER